MSSAKLRDDDFDFDPEAPPGFKSVQSKHRFTLLFSTAVGVVFVLQMVLPQILMAVLMPSMPSAFGGLTVEVPQPGRAFRWQGATWVPVQRVTPGRPPETVLKVLSPEGNWDDDREVVLTAPSPEHCVADGDRLWMVSANTVSTLQQGQVTTLYPKLRLNDPVAAFLCGGKLCVLDRQPDRTVRRLEFEQGEWTARATFALPAVAGAPGMTPPRVGAGGFGAASGLSVVEQDGEPWLYHAENNHLWAATVGDLPEIPALDESVEAAVQADAPANVEGHALSLDWIDFGEIGLGTAYVVRVDGRLALITRTQAQIQSRLAARWLDALDQPPFSRMTTVVLEQLGVVADEDSVAVVTDTFPPGGCRVVPFTAEGFGPASTGAASGLFSLFGKGFVGEIVQLQIWTAAITTLLTLVLVIAGQMLMARHRDLRYGFGHDVVRLGSLVRRSLARMVDTLIFAVPIWTVMGWALWRWGTDPQQWLDAFLADWQQALVTALLVVLGVMAYGLFTLFFMGALEGWCGWTPGKLLFGLRVCRTNLRKCGALRGAVRQILLIIDGLFNYVVGIALIAFLPKCQRLGDLAMDTIVVEAWSLPRPGELRSDS